MKIYIVGLGPGQSEGQLGLTLADRRGIDAPKSATPSVASLRFGGLLAESSKAT